MIEQIRKQYSHTLVLDAGDMFAPEWRFPDIYARTVFRAMEKMGYDAVNVADGDLSLGIAFFNALSENSSIHRLSATLKDAKTGKRVYPPYLLRDVGSIRVAIIGLTASSLFTRKILDEDGLALDPAKEQLRQLLNELQPKADIVILLSHMKKEGTLNLLQQEDIAGVDVAIVGHNSDPSFDPIRIKDTIVVENGTRGEYLGKLVLTVGEAKQIVDFNGELVRLSSDIPDSPWAADLIAAFETDEVKLSKQARKTREARERQEKIDAMVQEQMKLLKMSPEEAIKNLPVPTQKLY